MNIFGGEKSRLANFQNMAGSGIQRQSTIYTKDQKDVLADNSVCAGTSVINYNINFAPLTILHIQYLQTKPTKAIYFYNMNFDVNNRIICYLDFPTQRPRFYAIMNGVAVFFLVGTTNYVFPCYYITFLTINSSGSIILANFVKIIKNAVFSNSSSAGAAFANIRTIDHGIQSYSVNPSLYAAPGKIIKHDVIQKFDAGISNSILLKHTYEKIGDVSLHL